MQANIHALPYQVRAIIPRLPALGATMTERAEAPPTDLRTLGSPLAPARAWWCVTLMLACAFLGSVDRYMLAVFSPMILSDLHLNAQQYGEILGSFSVAYILGNPAWGAILDRFGLPWVMALSVTIWAIGCGAQAVVSGLLGLAAARTLLGFSAGATCPGGLRTAMDWLPVEQQSRGIAVAYSGSPLAAIVTSLVVTFIALSYGWRATWIVTGIAGLGWVVAWRGMVQFSAAPRAVRTHQIVLPNLLERRFWSLVAAYGLGALPIGLILYLAPLYLTQVLGFREAQLGRVLWIPPLGWQLGYLAWGWLGDRFVGTNSRPSQLVFLLAFLGLPLLAVPLSSSSTLVLGLMFWSMFVAAGFIVIALRSSALAYPREQTGLVAGMGEGSRSAILAAVMPSLGHMFDVKHYANAFLFCALMPVIGAFCWWSLTLTDRNLPEMKG
jgi:MFS transporter, ACS family, hexuronate transporter